MKRSAKSITKAILTAAALLAAAFIYNGAEADAGMSKPLERGQYFQAGTCTTTVMTGEQQIKPRDNFFGDKFGYHGEYYYNGSDHPYTAVTFIDNEREDDQKYYKFDTNIAYATRIATWEEGFPNGHWGPEYDLPRGYYNDESHFYCLYLIPGPIFDRPRELHFYMEDKGEPWGVQVLSGDGTREHPIRFGLLFSEPYSVGFNPIEHGTASAHPNAEAGETVELDLAPDYGYEVDSVAVKRADNGKAVEVTFQNDKYSYVMPEADVVVDVTYKFNPDLTIVAGISGSSGTVDYYDSLEKALSKWRDGTTLTLFDGARLEAPINIMHSKTLDLNGYVLQTNGKAFAVDGGNLTINDSEPDRKTSFGRKTYTGGHLIGSVAGASEDGLVADALISVANGSLTINGGTLVNQQSDDFPTWAVSTGEGAKVRISDGYFNAFKTIAMGTNKQVSVELAGGYHYANPTKQDMEFWPIVWVNGRKETTGIEVTGGYYRYDPNGLKTAYYTVDPLPIADGYEAEEENGQTDWKWDDCDYRVVGRSYDITTDDNMEHGTVQAPERARLGEKVILTAASAEHYRLKNYIVKDAAGKELEVTDGTFTMPNSAVTVSAVFEGIPVTKLRLNKVRVTLNEGGSETIRVAVTPSDALNKKVTWESENTSIATVSDNGLIRAVGNGKTKVTATAVGSGVSVSCVVTVQHTHRLTKVEATEANCVTEGNIEYWKCDQGEHACGRLFADENGYNEIVLSDTVIPIDGERHGQIADPGFETTTETLSYRTCTTPLNQKRITRCKDCGAVISVSPNGEPAYGHKWGEWTQTAAPTEDQAGEEIRVCQRDGCGAEETRVIPSIGHTHILTHVAAKAATCTEPGNKEYWVCDGCGIFFKDKEGAIKIDPVTYPRGHRAGEEKKENEKAATCDTVATYESVVCCDRDGCGAELSREIKTEGNALGHDWDGWGKFDGNMHKRVCKRDEKHVDLAPHRWDAGHIDEEGGKIAYMCIDCYEVMIKDNAKETGHKSKLDNGAVVKGKTVKLKAKKLKKKAQNIARNKAIYLNNAQGAVTFAKGTVTYKKAKSVKLNKKKLNKYKKSLKKKFVVNKKTGRITAKKGLKKGIYKLSVTVTCAGNASYAPCTKTVTVTIKVR